MNQLTVKSLATALMLATAVSSGAAASPNAQLMAARPPLAAPTVGLQKQALNPAELAKYQRMTDRSHRLAQHEAAGGKGKTVAIVVVAVVVVAVAIVVLRAEALGSLAGGAGG